MRICIKETRKSNKIPPPPIHDISDFEKSQINMAACCVRHQKSLTSKIIEFMGRQTHNKSKLYCNLKPSILAIQEPNCKFATAKSSK